MRQTFNKGPDLFSHSPSSPFLLLPPLRSKRTTTTPRVVTTTTGVDVVEGAPVVEVEEDADKTKTMAKEITKDCGAPKTRTKAKSKLYPPRKTFPRLRELFALTDKIKT